MRKIVFILFAFLILLLAACAPAAEETAAPATSAPTLPPSPSAMQTPTPTAAPAADLSVTPTLEPSPTPTLSPDAWMDFPIVPEVSDTAREIYQRGLEMGNNPHAFSKIGDCQNVNSYFLAVFEHPEDYRLGEEYAYLQETIDYFDGSFSRQSLAVKGGFNVAAVLSPFRSDKSVCEANESPLACELRVNHPSFAIISLEQWWGKTADEYEKYMRQIIEYTISKGVVPILATKADNCEGDNSINRTIVKLAYEYDIPLWNFWKAAHPLPHHGLAPDDPDQFHLTFARNYFDDPQHMEAAWPWRNLTALQALDAVRRGVTSQP